MILELCFVLLCSLVVWILLDKNGKKNLAPGPTRLPIIGNLVQMAMREKKAPYLMLEDLSKEYGPIFSLQLGLTYQVVFNDFNTIKEVLASDNWADRYTDGWILARSFGKPNGILFGNGESWKELRRFTIRTLRDFGFGKQKGQDVIMEEELTTFLERLEEKRTKQNNILDMHTFFNVSVLNIIWSMIAGERFSHDDPRLHNFVATISNVMRMMSAGDNMMMAFPFLRHFTLRFTEYGRQRKTFLAQIHQEFKDMLRERKSLGYYKTDQRDFVDVFLNEIDSHRSKTPNYYTDDQYSTCILDLFAAGSETTSSTLEFAVVYMILNPEVQTKVQDEIDRVVGRHRLPNNQDRSKMPYTEATLLEIQRVANIVPVTIRTPIQDTIVGSYHIPKGSLGIFNLHSVHMNPKIWDEPEKFRPERFLDSAGTGITNTQYLLPFGFGKRLCLGEILAKSTLFTYFATLLQRYNFAKSPSHPEPSVKPQTGMTQCPFPYHALITQR